CSGPATPPCIVPWASSSSAAASPRWACIICETPCVSTRSMPRRARPWTNIRKRRRPRRGSRMWGNLRDRYMIRPLRNLTGGVLRHPLLSLLALLLVVGAGAASAFLWSQYQLDAARTALERYDFDEAQHHLDLCLEVRWRSAAIHLLAAQTARR